jgi:hypothetical protein
MSAAECSPLTLAGLVAGWWLDPCRVRRAGLGWRVLDR